MCIPFTRYRVWCLCALKVNNTFIKSTLVGFYKRTLLYVESLDEFARRCRCT